MKAIGTPDL